MSDNNNNFYHGYDEQHNTNNDVFYNENTYLNSNDDLYNKTGNTNSFDHEDANNLYYDIRARKVINYDNFGFGAVSMETVWQMHPNAKLAGPIDARSRLIKMLIVAGIFLIIGFVFLSFYFSHDSAQNDHMNNSAAVQGEVQHILEGNKFPEHLLRIKSYKVLYKYYYEGVFYNGSDLLTLDQLQSIGLTNISSDNQGKKITAYADMKDPNYSWLVKENFIGRGFAFFIVFAVIAFIFVIIGLKRHSDCMTGRVAVYINETEKKVYQRITR